MPQTLLEMTKDLVLAQIQSQQIAPEALHSALNTTYQTLQSLDATESAAGNGHSEAAAQSLEGRPSVDWKGSIAKQFIRCLECGDTFKQLSLRHLRVHDLDPRSYRAKYGIPRTQSISAREVTVRRRELAQQMRPWELAPSTSQPPSKTTVTPKTQAPTTNTTATSKVQRKTAKSAKSAVPRTKTKATASRPKTRTTAAKS